jgi:uncharacterized pyridoxamine 5'-phosphate oxidase family protein
MYHKKPNKREEDYYKQIVDFANVAIVKFDRDYNY